MLSTSNGHHKYNGRVSPADEETVKKLGKEEIKNTFMIPSTDPVEPTQVAAKKSFIYRLFKKDEKEKEKEKAKEAEAVPKKKPAGRKLKSFEIVCYIIKNLSSSSFFFSFFQYKFATKFDVFLMVLGTIIGRNIKIAS